jgi:hypothetical protein
MWTLCHQLEGAAWRVSCRNRSMESNRDILSFCMSRTFGSRDENHHVHLRHAGTQAPTHVPRLYVP